MIVSIKKLRKKIFTWRFFTISLLVHVILVLVLGGKILFNKATEPPDFTGEQGSGFVSEDTNTQPPPQQVRPVQQPNFTVHSVAPSMSIAALVVNAPTNMKFTMPVMVGPVSPQLNNLQQQQTAVSTSGMSGGMPSDVASGIKGFIADWSPKGSPGPGSDLRSRQFQFTAYLARYAGGDWDSTVHFENGKISGGSLPNLLYVMGKLSRDKIKGDPQSVPLDLSSGEIFVKKPPFIIFTGHKDFKLTDKEVENLQKYVRLGGCIWGDSSVPGRRSRFDLAFRREMRRVVPDVNKDFEELPLTHPIYTNAYYKEIQTVPAGINYYHEPIYALKVYGEIAILYTANDYGDMWQFALTEKGEFDLRQDEHGAFVAMNGWLWQNAANYFGNISPGSVFPTYKFGTNIIVHLLTRWEDKVRNAPSAL